MICANGIFVGLLCVEVYACYVFIHVCKHYVKFDVMKSGQFCNESYLSRLIGSLVTFYVLHGDV